MRRIIPLEAPVLLACLSSCGGEPRIRAAISTVELVSTENEVATRVNHEVFYRSGTGKIDKINTEVDGVLLLTREFEFYDSGRLKGYRTRLLVDGVNDTRVEYVYEDGRLVQLKHELEDGSLGLTDLHWDANGTLSRASYRASLQDGTQTQIEHRYGYDSSGRVVGDDYERRVNGDLVFSRDSDLRYGEEQVITRVTDDWNDGARQSLDFVYNSEDQLTDIEVSNGVRFRLTYDGNGLISEIENFDAVRQVHYIIGYEQLDVEGLVFTPQFGHGAYFDMSGRSFDHPTWVNFVLN